jgi:hypothetical protein
MARVAKAAGLSSQVRLKPETKIVATFRYSTTVPVVWTASGVE